MLLIEIRVWFLSNCPFAFPHSQKKTFHHLSLKIYVYGDILQLDKWSERAMKSIRKEQNDKLAFCSRSQRRLGICRQKRLNKNWFLKIYDVCALCFQKVSLHVFIQWREMQKHAKQQIKAHERFWSAAGNAKSLCCQCFDTTELVFENKRAQRGNWLAFAFASSTSTLSAKADNCKIGAKWK